MVGAPRRAVTYFLLAAMAFAISLSGVLPTAARAQEREQEVTVTRVVDGDTVEVSPAVGGKEDVRLIGVDTPETVDPNEDVQPYGPQASRFTTRKLEGERVTLEFDQDREDRFDRLLSCRFYPAWHRPNGSGVLSDSVLPASGAFLSWAVPCFYISIVGSDLTRQSL